MARKPCMGSDNGAGRGGVMPRCRSKKASARFLHGVEVARRLLANPPSVGMRPIVGNGPRFLGFLWEAQGGKCAICGEDMPWQKRYHVSDSLKPTIDHVIPLSKGGAVGFGNIVATHLRCNNSKGARMPTEAELAKLQEVTARLSDVFIPMPCPQREQP
jgi:5-methylcytosine-specific restriction endonuclease McrA